jgi:flagellin-like hook-associated protein FlgL
MTFVSITGKATTGKITRFLQQIQEQSRSAFERLSSGSRINKASDDAAGLSISSRLAADSRIFQQAVRNVNDGISLLSIAEQALSSLEDIITRQSELAEQAANGVYSGKQRLALDQEASQLTDEVNRIIQTTTFNGITLLDGSLKSGLEIQAGYGPNSVLSIQLGKYISRTVGDGTFQPEVEIPLGDQAFQATVSDFNRDGIKDIAAAYNDIPAGYVAILIGNGDGTFTNTGSIATDNGTRAMIQTDFNRDGYADLVTANSDPSSNTASVLLGNGDGTFQPQILLPTGDSPFDVKSGDFDADGYTDFLTTNRTSDDVTIYYGDGSGNFSTGQFLSTGVNTDPRSAAIADFNGDGREDFIVSHENNGSPGATVFLSNGDRTFTTFDQNIGGRIRTVETADFNSDGIPDLVATRNAFDQIGIHLGNGDGTFSTQAYISSGGDSPRKIAVGDLNGDLAIDVAVSNFNSSSLEVFFGNGDGTLSSPVSLSTSSGPQEINFADFNNDGAPDILTGQASGGNLSIFIANTTTLTTIEPIDLTSQDKARSSLTKLSETLNSVIAERGSLGAFSKRLTVAIENLKTSRIATDEAENRISGADIASESAKFLSNAIREASTAALLAKQNTNQNLALELIQNSAS